MSCHISVKLGKPPKFRDSKKEFCEVIRNHVALSPARKAHSISVLALISLMGEMNHARSSSDTDFSIIFPELLKQIAEFWRLLFLVTVLEVRTK